MATEFRPFDPEQDSIDELAQMNEWEPHAQKWFAGELRTRLDPKNAFVAVEDGHLVGAAFIMDGGFPFAVIDGVYIRPDHRSMAFANESRQALEKYAAELGLRFFFSHCAPQLAHVLERADYLRASDDTFHLMLKKVS